MDGYLAIARKYRPQQFNQLIGQEHICSTLTNAIKSGKVAHAYLFSGPKGIGKTTVARILAKAINCAEGPTDTPCDKCPSCLDIIKGNSMDVIEVDGASNRRIDEIRELRDNVRFAASGGRFKVYIIDEVHMLTTEAFNALLKTLEEPPPHVKFFFATTEPEKVLSTIISRCQRFELRPIKSGLIAERLKNIAEKEGVKVGTETLNVIAGSANGGMRDAESILDKLIAYSGSEIRHEEALDILGAVDKDVLFDISSAITGADTKKALILIEKILERGKDLNGFLSALTGQFRNMLISKYGQDTRPLLEMTEEDIARTAQAAKDLTVNQITEIIDSLIQLQGSLKWSLSKRASLEVGIIKICGIRKKIPLDALVHRLESLEKSLGAVGHTEYTPETSTVAENTGVQPKDNLLDRVKESWADILDGINKQSPVLKTYLAEGSVLALNGNTLTVGFAPSCSLHQESLSKPHNKETLENKMKEILGTRVNAEFKIIESMEKPRTPKPADSPMVEKVRQAFGAKIVGVKRKS